MNVHFSYDLDEVLTDAIMSNQPALIVEGKDDIRIYEQLSNIIDKPCTVYPIQSIANYAAGCTSVISCIERLQAKFDENPNNIQYVLGIADRDARYYRREIPDNLRGLLILKYYSIESHFITQANLRYILPLITNATYLSDSHVMFIENFFCLTYENLYYISLEALKNACIASYKGLIGYSASDGVIKNQQLIADLLDKRDSLDQFAEEFNIDQSYLKKIAKGKWLLFAFCDLIIQSLQFIPEECDRNTLPSCSMCKREIMQEKCRWSMRSGCNRPQVLSLITNFFDENEFEYIFDRIEALA